MKKSTKTTGKSIASLAVMTLCASAFSPTLYAGTGLCVTGITSSIYEIKVISCDGTDCAVEMDRTNFTSIPSTGGFNLGGDPLVLNWNGAFAGTTQGTIHYSCELNPGTELPLTGTGMRQRTANFTNGTAEYLTGTCSLDLCSAPSASRQLHSGQDEDTQP